MIKTILVPTTTVQLPQVAVQLRADLLVAAGFGRSPLRERVRGGLTRSLLEHAEFPRFMLHQGPRLVPHQSGDATN